MNIQILTETSCLGQNQGQNKVKQTNKQTTMFGNIVDKEIINKQTNQIHTDTYRRATSEKKVNSSQETIGGFISLSFSSVVLIVRNCQTCHSNHFLLRSG